jgi:hypothetical protein
MAVSPEMLVAGFNRLAHIAPAMSRDTNDNSVSVPCILFACQHNVMSCAGQALY